MRVVLDIDIPDGWSIPTSDMVKRLVDPDWHADWWHIEDVQSASNGSSLSDEEAREVLCMMNKYADCNVGINWDAIEVWNDWVMEDREPIQCCICKEKFDMEDVELVDDGSGDHICIKCMHPEEEDDA